MPQYPEFQMVSPAEWLTTLANLMELALYAPEGEVTIEGRVALQRAAREIVVLTGQMAEHRHVTTSKLAEVAT